MLLRGLGFWVFGFSEFRVSWSLVLLLSHISSCRLFLGVSMSSEIMAQISRMAYHMFDACGFVGKGLFDMFGAIMALNPKP